MHPVEEQDQEDDFEQRMQGARELCDRQEFKAALPKLRSLYREKPGNQQVLYHLFMAERLFPASEQFHQVSNHILTQSRSDPAFSAMVHDVFQSYVRLARPKPRISADLACRLIARFEQTGNAQSAQILRRKLPKRGAECTGRN